MSLALQPAPLDGRPGPGTSERPSCNAVCQRHGGELITAFDLAEGNPAPVQQYRLTNTESECAL